MGKEQPFPTGFDPKDLDMNTPIERLNPFHYRGPMKDASLFCDRERPRHTILQLLKTAQSINLCGKSRVGKTSLVFNLLDRLENTLEFEKIEHEYIGVYVDLAPLKVLSASPKSLPMQFFRVFFKHIHQALKKSRHVRENLNDEAFNKLQNFQTSDADVSETDFLLRVEDYLNILFDEDSWKSYIPFTLVIVIDAAEVLVCDNIGAPMRVFANLFHLSYIFITRQPFYKLDPQGILSEVTNICTIIPLGMLDKEGAEKLLETVAPDVYKLFGKDDRNLILEMGGGHPDFVLISAWTIFNSKQNDKQPEKDELFWKIKEALHGVCLTLWNSLSQEEKFGCWQVANGEKIGLQSKPSFYLLSDYGIINDKGELFSPVFRDFVLKQPAELIGDSKQTFEILNKERLSHIENLQIENDSLVFDNKEVDLTPQESSFMSYLSMNLGVFCKREDLYIHVWGEDHYDEKKNSSTINMAVQRLREKLRDKYGTQLLIESKRGEGYRLIIAG